MSTCYYTLSSVTPDCDETMLLLGFHVLQVVMAKQLYKDYIGSFSKNPHVAQCFTCWLHDNEKQWYQKKTMEYSPSEKHTFQDGSTKIEQAMFFCQPCQDSWGDDNGYEGWSNEEYNEHLQHLVNTNQRPITVEILN